MAPKEPKFIANVSVTSHADEKVIGTAKIEQLPGGACIAHIDASEMTAEQLRRGFSLGSFKVPEEPVVQLEKELDR